MTAAGTATDVHILVPISLGILCVILLYYVIVEFKNIYFPSSPSPGPSPPTTSPGRQHEREARGGGGHGSHTHPTQSQIQFHPHGRNSQRINSQGGQRTNANCYNNSRGRGAGRGEGQGGDEESLDYSTDSLQQNDSLSLPSSSSHNLLPSHQSQTMTRLIRQQILTVRPTHTLLPSPLHLLFVSPCPPRPIPLVYLSSV